VFFTVARPARSFVREYNGELITAAEGRRREAAHDDDSAFRFFFPFSGKKLW